MKGKDSFTPSEAAEIRRVLRLVRKAEPGTPQKLLRDQLLTEWMCSELRIAVWPSPPGTRLATVEGKVMDKWLPPLNLIGVRTPWTDEVRAARAAMAVRAREWARERGFDG